MIEAVVAGAAGYLLKGTQVEKIVEAIKDVKAGGAVIQPTGLLSSCLLISQDKTQWHCLNMHQLSRVRRHN